MKLQAQKERNVKVSVQPYPYVKELDKGQGRNKSFTVYEATPEEVFNFVLACVENNDSVHEMFEKLGIDPNAEDDGDDDE